MIINLGYVAISMKLKDSSPNKTITMKSLEKLDRKLWESKVENIGKANIASTIRILRYNKGYGIKMYRLTSKLIPLVTHPELREWDWKSKFHEDFSRLGEAVKETQMRISTHPDHFTILNSPRVEVVEAAIRDLDYHCSMFELMGLGPEYKMNIHIGGMYKDKLESIKRFKEGFMSLEDRIKERIVLENDDKIFNAEEVLLVCRELEIPMVVDVHHDFCNPSSRKLSEMASEIFSTWKGQSFPPKIHLSSPKSEKDIRSHHDYINPEDLLKFLRILNRDTGDFDIMVEAKMKDMAVFKLIDDLRGNDIIKKIEDCTIEINL
jgi:UV DNA damage endonuclease